MHEHRRLIQWLLAYCGSLELMVIRVRAGGSRISPCRDLAKFYYLYRRAVPSGGAPVVRLAAAHRRVLEALCAIREQRTDKARMALALDELAVGREQHGRAVQDLLESLQASFRKKYRDGAD